MIYLAIPGIVGKDWLTVRWDGQGEMTYQNKS